MKKTARKFHLHVRIQEENAKALKRWALERSITVGYLLDIVLNKAIPEQYRKSYDDIEPTE